MQLGLITASSPQRPPPSHSAPQALVREQAGFIDHCSDDRPRSVPASNLGGFVAHDRQPPVSRQATAAPSAAPTEAPFRRHEECGLWNRITKTSPGLLLGETAHLGLPPAPFVPEHDDILVLTHGQHGGLHVQPSWAAVAAVLERYRAIYPYAVMLPEQHYLTRPLADILSEFHDSDATLLFVGAEAPDPAAPRSLVRALLRHNAEREPHSARWGFPRTELWVGTLAGALAFYDRCQQQPAVHWYTHTIEMAGVATDLDCALLQDLTPLADRRGLPLHSRMPVSAFLSGGMDDMPRLELQLVALHAAGMDDIVVAYHSPSPFPTADFPWVRAVQLAPTATPLPLVQLLHHDTVLLLGPDLVPTESLVHALHHQFTEQRHCIHGLFGYDMTLAPATGTVADLVDPCCLMVRRPYAALALTLQHLAPDCPWHMTLSKAVALAGGGLRHRLHPALRQGGTPPAAPTAEMRQQWQDLTTKSVRWAPFLQQYRHFLP
jgi:hypothetical protein